MKVYVNDKEVSIIPGMTIRHALIRSGMLRMAESGQKVYDKWGNEVGLDGAIEEGVRLYVRRPFCG
jgi:hypothetical protein